MTDENAASAATDKLALNSEVIRNASWQMEKRLDALMDLLNVDGEWLGDAEQSQEVAELTAAIRAMLAMEDPTDTRSFIDIELPSGQTFTALLTLDLAAELQRSLDRLKVESIDDANRRRATALADLAEAAARATDPEEAARFRFRHMDEANGHNGRKWAFEVDSPYGSIYVNAPVELDVYHVVGALRGRREWVK